MGPQRGREKLDAQTTILARVGFDTDSTHADRAPFLPCPSTGGTAPRQPIAVIPVPPPMEMMRTFKAG